MYHDGQTAVVTGAAGGIGAAITTRLAGNGAKVALLDIADEVTRTVAAVSEEHSSQTWTHRVDVVDSGAVQEAVEGYCGELDPEILVNNVAITANIATITEMPS